MSYKPSTLRRAQACAARPARAYGILDEAPEWWGELHDRAAARLTGTPQRPGDITDKWKIINDFLRIGLIVCKSQGNVPMYRLAREGDQLHVSAQRYSGHE